MFNYFNVYSLSLSLAHIFSIYSLTTLTLSKKKHTLGKCSKFSSFFCHEKKNLKLNRNVMQCQESAKALKIVSQLRNSNNRRGKEK